MRRAACDSRQDMSEMVDETVYRRLRLQATAILRHETSCHSLEPSDLAHDAFLRIARSHASTPLQDQPHFLALATIVMRHILIDNARGAKSVARSRCISLDSHMRLSEHPVTEGRPVKDALRRLESCEARLYRIVEMRFFWGLRTEEIASALSISSSTVKRDWTVARGWLRDELNGTRQDGSLHATTARIASSGSSSSRARRYSEAKPVHGSISR